MKKIYLALAGIAFCSSIVVGQPLIPADHSYSARPTKDDHLPPRSDASTHSASPIPFKYWIDPIGDMVYNRGFKIYPVTGTTNDIVARTSVLFIDSSVVLSDNIGKSSISEHAFGTILDPKSTYLLANANGTPSKGAKAVVTANDEYFIDSVGIKAWYIKRKIAVKDTLYVWVTWANPYNDKVFTTYNTKDLWGIANFATWRDTTLNVNLKGWGVNQPGNVIASDAPSTNVMLVKRVLTNDDTVAPDGSNKIIRVKLDSAIRIPANNVVSCYYAYIPQAGSYAPGDCIYTFQDKPKVRQVSNGFGAWVWVPRVSVTTDKAVNFQVDPSTRWPTGMDIYKYDRYPNAALPTAILPGWPLMAASILYHISGMSTVGIDELSANGNFSLGQNIPNPFTNETTISYQLRTNAKNASLVIYNVAGVKMFEQAQRNLSEGTHTVNVTASNLSTGVYFYSLTVDGNKVTKKMIVTE